MSWDVKYIMRTLLVLLLLQFVSPALFSVVTVGSVSEDSKTTFTTAHSSIVVPVFLKEQEEREHEEETLVKSFELAPLIDFSNQSLSHTASQSLIYKGYTNQDRFGSQPPLFKRNRTFLI